MNFERIAPVPEPVIILNSAFSKAREKTARESAKFARTDASHFWLNKEKTRLSTAAGSINHQLTAIIAAFPVYSKLPDFYRELKDITINITSFKQSLGKVHLVSQRITLLAKEYMRKMQYCHTVELL